MSHNNNAERFVYAAWRLRDEYRDEEVAALLETFPNIALLWAYAKSVMESAQRSALEDRIWAEAIASRLEGY